MLAITVGILAFGEQIDHVLHPMPTVAARGQALSLSALENAIVRIYPTERILAFHITGQTEGTIGVRVEGHILTINRYTGRVLAAREDIPQQRALLQYVSRIHRTLMLGPAGSVLLILSAIALLALSISGIVLWVKLRNSCDRPRLPRIVFTTHHTIGIISSTLQLIVAVTGLFLVAGSPFLLLAARLSGPMPDFKVPASIAVPGAKRISADLALEVSQKTIPDMRPVRVGFPRDEEDSFAIQMAPQGSVGVGGQVSIEQ
jgi:hypothetical protein